MRSNMEAEGAEQGGLAAAFDPLFGGAPSPRGGGLDPLGRTRLARWLLDPGAAMDPEMRAALIAEIDLSSAGMVSAVVNFLLINGLCALLTGASVYYVGLGINTLCGAGRLLTATACRRRHCRHRAVMTDAYLFITLAWCAVQGVLTGLAMASNNSTLQVVCGITVLAVQGALAARNYAAPRFASLMLGAVTLPFVIGMFFTRDHFLTIIALQAPFYVLAYTTTIRRFHGAARASQELLQRSRHQARHDPLTGALNRFGLMSALQSEVGRRGAPFALFYLDLDGFKLVNDSHGHAAGDRLLRMVADRLRGVSRGADEVARLGGDEFVIVVAGLSPTAAELFAARIIEAVAGAPYAIDAALSVSVGVSVGFACATTNGAALPELFMRADQALYRAKSKGKGVWQRG